MSFNGLLSRPNAGRFVAFSMLACLLFAGCSRNFESSPTGGPGTLPPPPSPTSEKVKPSSPSDTAKPPGAEDDARFSRRGFSFSIPSQWVANPPSGSFRQAQYRLPAAEGDGEGAELVVYHFGGQGGSVQANLERWKNQFTPAPNGPAPRSESREVEGIRLTVLDIEGTYNQPVGPIMQGKTKPRPGYRMLATVAETTSGPYFLKLTGPRKTVAHWLPAFDQLLNSVSSR